MLTPHEAVGFGDGVGGREWKRERKDRKKGWKDAERKIKDEVTSRNGFCGILVGKGGGYVYFIGVAIKCRMTRLGGKTFSLTLSE